MDQSMTAPRVKRIHPKKFALWAGLVSITMMFAAFTSAYLVRASDTNWVTFPLPQAFFWSTGIMLMSSLILHLSYRAYVQKNIQAFKGYLVFGFVLGILFVLLQYQGWLHLNSVGIYIYSHHSSSFLFLISGIHAVHVIGGIVALLVALIYGFLPNHQKATTKGKLRLELIFTYWHFVDILWLYLFVFFLIQQ